MISFCKFPTKRNDFCTFHVSFLFWVLKLHLSLSCKCFHLVVVADLLRNANSNAGPPNSQPPSWTLKSVNAVQQQFPQICFVLCSLSLSPSCRPSVTPADSLTPPHPRPPRLAGQLLFLLTHPPAPPRLLGITIWTKIADPLIRSLFIAPFCYDVWAPPASVTPLLRWL